ncbi:MAG: hypothetical protein L0154_24015, partial [Chloroflexi bacterium]|nr:hypothetical protein [Chloroflexota bacterium]
MSQDVKEIIRQAVGTIIDEAITDQKLSELARIHHDKIHFVPAKYRVIGGVLQSLNIKFGNFIEQIIQLVVERDPKVMSHKSSGQRLKLYISPETDQLIDRYITARRALTASGPGRLGSRGAHLAAHSCGIHEHERPRLLRVHR